MGIFGNDKLQDERLDALEEHVRSLTETVQANQADLAQTWIVMLLAIVSTHVCSRFGFEAEIPTGLIGLAGVGRKKFKR